MPATIRMNVLLARPVARSILSPREARNQVLFARIFLAE
jgi:hypothetical protein